MKDTMTKARRLSEAVMMEYRSPDARQVSIAGTFNDWDPDGFRLIPVGGGRWARELLLAPGTYEYLYIVDGHWVADPGAQGTVPNPFGGSNSLLTVPEPGWERSARTVSIG